MFSKKDYEIFISKIYKEVISNNSSLTCQELLRFRNAIFQYKIVYGEEWLAKMGIYVVGKDTYMGNVYLNKANILL